MSTHNPWVASTRRGLEELERRAERGLDAASAYRVLVLLARLEQARAAGLDAEVPESLRRLGERVSTSAVAPSPEELLERLEEVLAGNEEPFGELLDVLLQVDDWVSAGEARGERAATELALLVDARVSLEAARVGPLGDMAERRLATLPQGASIRGLWETVARSAVDATVAALPSVGPRPGSRSKWRLAARLQERRGFSIYANLSGAPVLKQLGDARAADVSTPSEPFEQETVSLYEDDQRLVLHVDLPPDRQPGQEVELHVSAGGREAVLRFHISQRFKRAAIVELGSMESLCARLRSEGLLSAPGEEYRVEVVLALKERGNEP